MTRHELLDAITTDDPDHLITAVDRDKVRRVLLGVLSALDNRITLGALHGPAQVFVRLALSLPEDREPAITVPSIDDYCHY